MIPNNYYFSIFLTNKKTVDESYLMEEVLVDHIFNSLDFLFVCCSGEVAAVRVSIQELVVLWLEVFSVNMWRRVAVQ